MNRLVIATFLASMALSSGASAATVLTEAAVVPQPAVSTNFSRPSEFAPFAAVVAALPEQVTWSLMILAFAATGSGLRHRRRTMFRVVA